MLLLLGTIAVALGFCLIAAGLYEKEEKDGETPKEKDKEIEG